MSKLTCNLCVRVVAAALLVLFALTMPLSVARADNLTQSLESTEAANAVESADDIGTRVGSITLKMTNSTGSDSTMTGGKMSLYRVATVSRGEDKLEYDVSGGQFGSSKTVADIPTMTKKELDAQNANLSKALVQEIASSNVSALQTVDISNGEARFPTVEEGLYLLVQTQLSNGSRKVNAFLMSVPNDEGELDVVGKPKPGATGTTKSKEKGTKKTAKASDTDASKVKLRVPTTGDILTVFMPLALAGLVLVLVGASVGRRSSRKA